MKNRIVLMCALLLSPVVAFATVTGTATSATFTCTNSTGPYPFSFPVSSATALTVTQNGIVLAPGNYTISPVNNSYDNGGSVTLNTACPSGQTLVLQRVTPVTQLTQFTPYMPALYADIEDGLDQLTEIDQELYADYTTIKPACGTVPIGIPCGGTGATTAAGANLAITGVTQTGTLGTSSQVSAFPGTVQGATITDGTASLHAGSLTGAVNGTFSGTVAAGAATPTTIGSNGVLLNGVPALQAQTSLYNYYSGGAGNLNGTGVNNTANGMYALFSNTTGSDNTANGYTALYDNTTGNSNIAIGLQSGWYLADGTTGNINSSNSVFEGNFTKAAAASDTNEIVIGYSAIGAGSNTAVIGNSSVTDVYLGSASANASLHAGGITDSGLTTAGYVTNNASGALGTVATIPYSALSGTVPTWNQNTTGTAANITATRNSTLTTLSALSLPYSQLTGTPSTSTTVNGQTCTLGSSCTVTASASGITVGTTTVSGSTTGHVLYNNGGTLGDIATTGSGSVVLSSTLGSYLPLSGGTLTGGLTGTTANFTGNTTFGTSGAGNTIDLYGTVTVRPQAAATSLTNYNSNNLYIAGSYYSTSTSQPISSDWEFTNIVGSGSSPTSVLTIANADTNETRSISMLYPVTVASLSNSNGVVIPLSTTGYTGSGNVVLSSTLGSYLPLSGGSLTGALSGTTASFTGAVTLGGTISAMVHYLGFSDMSNSVYSPSAAVSWLQIPVNMTLYNTVTAAGVSCTSQARLLHAATASTTFNLDYDGVSFGTVTFAASASAGTFSWSSGLSVAAENAYEVYAPSTADATAAGLSLTICATY